MAADDDDRLVTLSDAMRSARDAMAALLASDSRDASDIPGYEDLADRHVALARAMITTPAMGPRGLLAKATAIDPRDAAMRSEGAIELALSLVADVLAVVRQA